MSAARLAPLHEFLEQFLALLDRDRTGRRLRPRLQEAVELLALRHGRRLRGLLLQPLLGAFEAGPARQRRGEIGLLPLRMARRLLEIGQPREEVVDEFLDAAIAI